MINSNKLEEEFPHPYVAVQVEYTAGFIRDELTRY